MSTQIAVRLPDDVVDFLDQAVKSGSAPSRAALVASALEREMRRLYALRDVHLLQTTGGGDDDLDPLLEWNLTQNEPELD